MTCDGINVVFSKDSVWILNLVLGFIMFGIALELKLDSFKKILRKPKAPILGSFSQFILLPALTFALVWVLCNTGVFDETEVYIGLGMMLVAACPGGNISNFVSSVSKANVELSVTLTAFSTVLAVVMTPLNFSLWGGLNPYTAGLLTEINVDLTEMFKTVFLMLGLPVVIGMLISSKLPKLTSKIIRPIKILSILIFGVFVAIAFVNNIDNFLEYIHLIALVVLAHNALGLGGGYLMGRLGGLEKKECRTLSIETGMQNSGLALALIFNPAFFNGNGCMALIAAWWGIWHIVSGLALAFFWSKIRPI